jgi:prepilin-type N-terminal cleavage/methylation domain-containing protein
MRASLDDGIPAVRREWQRSMNIKLTGPRDSVAGRIAFTLVEVMVGIALIGIVFVSLYAGMSSGFAVTQLARENLRATQILMERMEGIRLYNWDQMIYSNMIPSQFTNYYYPVAGGTESKGVPYYGHMYILQHGLNPSATYSTNMRVVVATVTWTNNNVPRWRWIWTYVSKHGVQNYVYYN